MSFIAMDSYGLAVACDPGDTVGLTTEGVVVEANSKFMRVSQPYSGTTTKVYSDDHRRVTVVRKFKPPVYQDKDVVLDPMTNVVWVYSQSSMYCRDTCCAWWSCTGRSKIASVEEFAALTPRPDKLVLISRDGKPYVPPVDVLGRFGQTVNGGGGVGTTFRPNTVATF